LNTIERCGLEIKYLRVRSGPQRGRYVHQLVMEAALGRSLMSFEEVDHIDGDTLNNCWLNLQIMTKPEHARKTRRQAMQKKQERRRARQAETADAENGTGA